MCKFNTDYIFGQILFSLKQKDKCMTEDAFPELGLDTFLFKRENKGSFLFLNAVYCWFL